eukprot:SAG11_NODE_23893_length_374_cov_2.191489_2_plen_48_part_01
MLVPDHGDGQNLAKMDVFGGLEASADDFTRDILGIICPSDCVRADGRS